MMRICQLASTVVLCLATSTQASTLPKFAANTTSTKYIINFGDSYSQTGFDLNSTLPSASNPLGNPAFPGWTTANGDRYNWLDTLIAKENKTLTYAINLASGGATTDATLVAAYEPYPKVQSFVNQTKSFLSSLNPASAAVPWTTDNTLFTIWMGVNDVGNGWYNDDWPTLLQAIGAQYFGLVDSLYAAGARKFVILQVPPIYLTPNVIKQGNETQQSLKNAILDYNEMLGATSAGTLIALPNVTFHLIDTEPAFMSVINDPGKYGAKNATCYSQEGTDCIWFNDYHPGQAIHDEVAKAVADAVGDW